MSNTTTLINFNIPTHLKSDLDELSQYKNVSRTSIFNKLIEDYVRIEFRLLDDDGRFKKLIRNMKLRGRVKKPTILTEYKEFKKPYLKMVDDIDDNLPNISNINNVDDDSLEWENRWD